MSDTRTGTPVEDLAVLYAAAIANTLACIDNNRDELESVIEAQIERKVSEPLAWESPERGLYVSDDYAITNHGPKHGFGVRKRLHNQPAGAPGYCIVGGYFRTLAEAKQAAQDDADEQ